MLLSDIWVVDMKFDLKKPCKDCPFRNDKPQNKGWLGEERAKEIYQTLMNDGLFPCHKTHDYSRSNDDGKFEHQDSHQFCAGALIMLENENTTFNSFPLRMAVSLEMLDRDRLDKNSPCFKNGQEFIDFHTKD